MIELSKLVERGPSVYASTQIFSYYVYVHLFLLLCCLNARVGIKVIFGQHCTLWYFMFYFLFCIYSTKKIKHLNLCINGFLARGKKRSPTTQLSAILNLRHIGFNPNSRKSCSHFKFHLLFTELGGDDLQTEPHKRYLSDFSILTLFACESQTNISVL